jgi:hypothetical protein
MCPWMTLENKLGVASQKPVLSQILNSRRVAVEIVVFLKVVPCTLVERYQNYDQSCRWSHYNPLKWYLSTRRAHLKHNMTA